MVLRDAASKLETFVWTFNYVLKSITRSLFDQKAPNLENLNVIFYVMVSSYRLVQI